MTFEQSSVIQKQCSVLVKEGKCDEARALIRRSRLAGAVDTVPALFLAECLILVGAVPHGLAEIADAEDATAVELAKIGTILFEKGNFQDSIEILERAKISDPSLPLIRESLTRALYASGEKIAAKIELDCFKSLIAETKEDIYRVFKLYQELKMDDFMEDGAKRVLSIDPDRIDVRRSLIDFHFKRNSLDKARDELNFFLECQILDSRALVFGARSYLRFTAIARIEIEQLKTTRDPFNMRRLEVAKLYMRSGRQADLDAAAKLAHRAIEKSAKPNFSAKVALLEAVGLSKAKPWIKAELNGLAELVTTTSEYADIAELSARLSLADDALKLVREAIKLDQSAAQEPSICIRLANILIAIKATSEAEVLLKSMAPETLAPINLLKQFHEACFKTTYDEGALRSANLILEQEPYTDRYVQRRLALSITSRPSSVTSSPAPSPGFFARLLRGSKP